ncbi:transposase [Mesorhizobium sp. B283B1A]|uniref:IS66-like element accessory protein TnpA n=1 Tax=Mesorhizobium TaxID=68287 RepID=UPI001CD081DA|nr:MULTISPECIES: transposase [Mesorhizobium]MCA0051396.1 transposase [Mesorhizobium sp. B283B1A]UQS62753.1 transposase [Mesorhizobium opportunistum]
MTISELTLKSSDPEPARRFEVFTGSGRRREWLPEEKARIVAESYDEGETVSAVARRYALSPQQLFAWRRSARVPLANAPAPEPLFVPAVVAAQEPEPAGKRARSTRKRKAAREAGVIELEIDGVAMRVGRGADARTVAAVIRALKAPS